MFKCLNLHYLIELFSKLVHIAATVHFLDLCPYFMRFQTMGSCVAYRSLCNTFTECSTMQCSETEIWHYVGGTRNQTYMWTFSTTCKQNRYWNQCRCVNWTILFLHGRSWLLLGDLHNHYNFYFIWAWTEGRTNMDSYERSDDSETTSYEIFELFSVRL